MSAAPERATPERERVHLPIVEQRSSLRSDGRRVAIVPADVHGRFTLARRLLFGALLAIGIALPLIRIEGRPAVFFDVPERRFFVFGEAFNAQDGWLGFFVLSGLGFGLLVLTTVLGRAWCGWACPQTVLLEGLFRPIERALEGPRNTRLRRDAGPRTLERTARKLAKHVVFAIVALLVAHLVLAYFVSMPSLGTMILEGPAAHPVAFAWSSIVGIALYVHAAWFREQLCLIVCPYGRLQSVLTDDDSLVVGYDERRGEPRGRGKEREGLGDCVDCDRCVVVCPTGIDIRNGLQIDCIACTQCIDACDEVMDKLHRPRGLIRYDSLRGLRGEARRIFRPRLAMYAVLGVVGVVALGIAVSRHQPLEATILRMRGAPFVVDGDVVRNTFEIHIVNKRDAAVVVALEPIGASGDAEIDVARRLELPPLGSARTMLVVRMPRDRRAAASSVRVRVTSEDASIDVEAPLLGPMR
ncbi:MAG: cytochrome c oxidase accessory protein CcoG [Myxococcota bacterium]|nr:cytochrome c oxidase accessory protein CcoG [Myxococcota bacterium]